ncbi:muconolactone Delta-isomerase family protein [Nocardioides bigeumensis]|uniref:Muconolactone isomerase domain-containing protein n=1 Tax=Nocardioides bigeumensis TaxID=433657 RepID=A0ABP5KJV5_9ACTN
MDFLVNVLISVPDGVTAPEIDRLREAEAVRASELAAVGHLVRLWRVPDDWANWGLWRADDEEALRLLLDSLPLRRFMTLTIHPLTPHPNDPG